MCENVNEVQKPEEQIGSGSSDGSATLQGYYRAWELGALIPPARVYEIIGVCPPRQPSSAGSNGHRPD